MPDILAVKCKIHANASLLDTRQSNHRIIKETIIHNHQIYKPNVGVQLHEAHLVLSPPYLCIYTMYVAELGEPHETKPRVIHLIVTFELDTTTALTTGF